MKSNKDFDSLKDKLKKLKALAERGCGGESENARRLLERLCAANGIDLGLLDDETKKRRYWFHVPHSVHAMLLPCHGQPKNEF